MARPLWQQSHYQNAIVDTHTSMDRPFCLLCVALILVRVQQWATTTTTITATRIEKVGKNNYFYVFDHDHIVFAEVLFTIVHHQCYTRYSDSSRKQTRTHTCTHCVHICYIIYHQPNSAFALFVFICAQFICIINIESLDTSSKCQLKTCCIPLILLLVIVFAVNVHIGSIMYVCGSIFLCNEQRGTKKKKENASSELSMI